MYYDKDASWKWIKCGPEEKADIWYIRGGANTGYEIGLAKNEDYILHFEGDADEDSDLLIKPSSKMGDHLWTFHAWHDLTTLTFCTTIHRCLPTIMSDWKDIVRIMVITCITEKCGMESRQAIRRQYRA